MPIIASLEWILQAPGAETFFVDVFLAAFAFAGSDQAAAVARGRFVGHSWCGLEGAGESGFLFGVEGGVHGFEADTAGARGVVCALTLLLLLLLIVVVVGFVLRLV